MGKQTHVGANSISLQINIHVYANILLNKPASQSHVRYVCPNIPTII